MKSISLIAAIAILASGTALAQTTGTTTVATPAAPATPRIDQRQVNQQKRIDQGVQSGALTEKEAARLQKRQDKIAAEEAAAKADGKVTKGERRKIEAHQDSTSRAIAKQKHDKQRSN
jgi:Skp family chaperone for outer membrane proteins